MTINEALERAQAIWGRARVSVVRQHHDGAEVEVQCLPGHTRASGVLASDTRDRHTVVHRLDANGHAICHDDCRELEGRLS